MPIGKNDDWCDCIIDDSIPNIIAQTSIFFPIYRNMYVEYKVEIQIREKWRKRRKAPSKGPTLCPLKRPQDVIFIFLHCTNSFLLSLTPSPSYFFPKLHIHHYIYISLLVAYIVTDQPCLPRFKTFLLTMVPPPHLYRNTLPPITNRSAVMSHKNGETGTPSGST